MQPTRKTWLQPRAWSGCRQAELTRGSGKPLHNARNIPSPEMMGTSGEKPCRVRITQLCVLLILYCCEAHVSRRWHRTGFSPVGALTQSPVCELGAARQSCPAGTAPLPRPAGGAARCAPEAASKCPPGGLAGGSSWGRPPPPERHGEGGGRAAPRSAAARCLCLMEKPLDLPLLRGCSHRPRGRGAAGAGSCPCRFPGGEQGRRSAYHIKTPFPYSYALFSTSRFY